MVLGFRGVYSKKTEVIHFPQLSTHNTYLKLITYKLPKVQNLESKTFKTRT